MSEINMNAKDAISAKLADCYVTIEGRRYLLMQAKDFEAKFEKTKKEINILGKTGAGNKSTGWKGTGKMTVYKIHLFLMSLWKDIKIREKMYILILR